MMSLLSPLLFRCLPVVCLVLVPRRVVPPLLMPIRLLLSLPRAMPDVIPMLFRRLLVASPALVPLGVLPSLPRLIFLLLLPHREKVDAKSKLPLLAW